MEFDQAMDYVEYTGGGGGGGGGAGAGGYHHSPHRPHSHAPHPYYNNGTHLNSPTSPQFPASPTKHPIAPELEPIRIIALDLASPPPTLDRLKAAIWQALDSTPDHIRVALVAFGAAATVCRLPRAGEPDSAIALGSRAVHFDVVTPPNDQQSGGGGGGFFSRRKKVATPERTPRHYMGRYAHVAPLGTCREVLRCAVDSLKPQRHPGGLQRLPPVIDACIWLLDDPQATVISSTTGAPISPAQQQQNMQRPENDVTAQLVLLTAAAALVAEGTEKQQTREREAAEELADELAMKAADHGVVIDVLTVAASANANTSALSSSASNLYDFGHSPPPPTHPTLTTSTSAQSIGGGSSTATGAAVLASLASGTGGRVLTHASVGSAMAANLQDALTRGVGASCTVEIRCSLGLKVTSTIGPVEPLTANGKKLSKEWGEVPKRLLSRNVWSYLANPPDMHQSVSVLLETTSAVSAQKNLYMQVGIVWSATDGTKTSRIVTKRLTAPLTPDQGGKDDAEGVHWMASSVMFSKQVAAEALERSAAHNRMQSEILRKGIGGAMRDVAEVLGDADESSRGWFSGPSRYALPRGGLVLAQVAFFLERVALHQGGALGDGDARELFYTALLAAPLEVAERMCCPALYVLLPSARNVANASEVLEYGLSGPALELQRVPSVDLALLVSTGGVIDAGTVVYVWLSAGTEKQQRVVDACMEWAQREACSRSPQADVVVVPQGAPQQAQVLSLLMPIATEPIEVQVKQLPMLSGFKSEQIEGAVREAERAWGELLGGRRGAGESTHPLGVTLMDWMQEQGVLPPGSVKKG